MNHINYLFQELEENFRRVSNNRYYVEYNRMLSIQPGQNYLRIYHCETKQCLPIWVIGEPTRSQSIIALMRQGNSSPMRQFLIENDYDLIDRNLTKIIEYILKALNV